MSLDKAIIHGKEHRKPYDKAKRYFVSCRNHGSCPWCKRNRQHKFRDRHPDEDFESIQITNDATL